MLLIGLGYVFVPLLFCDFHILRCWVVPQTGMVARTRRRQVEQGRCAAYKDHGCPFLETRSRQRLSVIQAAVSGAE